MKRLFRILITNAWQGLRRTGSLPTAAMVFLSVIALLVISTVVAGAFPHANNSNRPKTPVQHSKSQTLTAIGSTPLPAHTTSDSNKPKSKTSKDQAGKTLLSDNKASTSQKSAVNSAPIVVTNITLDPATCALNSSGQPVYTVQSASVTFQSPLAKDTPLGWYIETGSYIGPKPSQPPIPNAQTSQTVPAGSSQAVLMQGSSSQPLITAPASSEYGYSFLIHVLIGSSDVTPKPIPVPQGTSCPQTQP